MRRSLKRSNIPGHDLHRLKQAVQQSKWQSLLSTEQYRAGLVDFLSVLEAQRELYANEDQFVESQPLSPPISSHFIVPWVAVGVQAAFHPEPVDTMFFARYRKGEHRA